MALAIVNVRLKANPYNILLEVLDGVNIYAKRREFFGPQ